MKEDNKKRKKEDDEYQSCKYKKSDNSQSSNQPKSNKSTCNLSHFPMSERQQYALLKQMEDDSSSNYYSKVETTENSTNVVCHTSEGLSYSISTTVATSSLMSNLIGSDKKLQKRNGAGETMLIQMAKRGDLNSMKTLIAEGANINEQDYAGWTALHECSIRNFPHITNYLLQHGADVNCCGLQGDTALHDAVKNNCPEVVKLLLKYDADPFKRNDKGIRPVDLIQTEETRKIIYDSINSSKDKRYRHREANFVTLDTNKQEFSNDQVKQYSMHIEQTKNYKSQTSDSYTNEDQSSSHIVNNDKTDSKDSSKDPYAFEDEETTEKSSFCLSPHKISPNKSVRHKNHGNGSNSQNDEISNSKDYRYLSSPNQSGSHNSSPKVPPLRIRINGHSGADRQTSEDSQPPSLEEHLPPNSESSLISVDIYVNKSNFDQQSNIKPSNIDSSSFMDMSLQKSPSIDVKEEIGIKEEPIAWGCGDNIINEDERKNFKEENYQIKEEPKLSSTSSKRNNGRTLRSHTAAAQKGKDDEDHVSRAPIKKRKFKSRPDCNSGEKNSNSSACSSNTIEIPAINTQASTSSAPKNTEKNVLSLEINQDTMNSVFVPNNKILMSPSKNEMWDNPYQKALTLNQQINSLAFNLEIVHPKPPVGFQDFLLTSKQYLLANRIPQTNTIKKRSVPNDLKKLELIALFQEHEEVRYNQALKHQSEREQLRINAELEVIRAQNTAARQLAGQDRPFSFFTVTAYKNFTYIPDSALRSSDSNKTQNVTDNDKSEKFSSDDFIKCLQSVKNKYHLEKKKILTRHLHESESLMMVQRMDWELKLKEMILEDIHGDSSLRRMSVEHVPMTEVPNDFVLFTTDPFQIPGYFKIK